MMLLKLDECKELFRDEAAYAEFVKIATAAFEDAAVLTVDESVIGLGISPKQFSNGLSEELADKMTRWKEQ